MKDPIEHIVISPQCSVEFIAGICHALSSYEGEVYVHIGAVNGRPMAQLKREKPDEALPIFLRKQSGG